MQTKDKQMGERTNKFLQYINTALLSLILGVASMTSVKMTRFNNELKQVQIAQEVMKSEDTRLKTIQDINTISLTNLDTRVTTLEIGYVESIKNWVDLNYMRKPQK